MSRGWLREEQADLAAEKILDAAGAAFVERGVAHTGMADIARYAGCSRGTLYRYFKNRHELHLAFVNRMALDMAARVASGLDDVEDPTERLVEGILRSLREVRTTPEAAAWFGPGDSGIAADVASLSEVIDSLAGGFVVELLGRRDDPSSRLRAHWMIRVTVSLLTTPGASEEEERELIERFVAPGMLADLGAG